VLVAVGTTNRPKLAAANAVFTRLYSGVEVRSVEVRVDVPAQPIGDVLTQQGAVLRARAALAQVPADFGVGMEGGLRETLGGWALCSWAAVVDAKGALGVGGGAVIVLPPRVVERVLAGEELSPVMDSVCGGQETGKGPGAFGLLTGGALTRQHTFEDALVCALAGWRHPSYGR
jgi:inosine/xanthosine triphosphatase